MSGNWTLPGYTEIAQLGTGGFGWVVLARHEQTGELVAIKYLKPEFLTRPEIVEGFRREAWLLSGVQSPHVVRIRDFVLGTDGAALVMEAVPGVSLRSLLRAERALPPEAALAVLKGSLLGLAAAHAVGVVHRDYKPANVLVSQNRESKLVDFGLATLDGHTGLAAGSPAYMAPEQWAGQPGTAATDVYAATCVFFECVTGRRPFDAPPEQIKELHEFAPIPLDAVPEPLRALISRGMAKDSAQRPATAGAFVAELEHTARAAYGNDWESRGWQRLAQTTATLLAMSPAALLATAAPATLTKAAFWTAAKLKIAGAVLGAAAVAAAGVVVVQGMGDDAAPSAGPQGVDPRTYVYRTLDTIRVMRGTDVVGSMDAQGLYNPVFTSDGRFAFAVASDQSPDEIRALDTSSGSMTSVPCGCVAAVPIGDSEVAWLTADQRFMRVDLAAENPTPRPWPAQLPPADPNGFGLTVLSGGPGVVLTTDGSMTGGDYIDPHIVTPSGPPKPVGHVLEPVVVDAAFSPDGQQLAIVEGSVKTQACPDNASVAIIDVASAERLNTTVGNLPVIGDTGRGMIEDLWWSVDGQLYATFMLCERVSDVDARYVVEPSVWRFDGEGWQRVDPGPVHAVRQLDESTRLVLIADGTPGRFEAGTLYLERDGQRIKIAGGVRTLEAVGPRALPISGAPLPTTTSSPAQPSQPSVPTSDGPPGYVTYTHERFGFTSLVPDGYLVSQAPANGDGVTFTNPDLTATLTVWGANNTPGRSARAVLTDVVSTFEADGGQVTFQQAEGGAYTVSGYLADGQIFYERAFVGPGSLAGMRWVYPKRHKEALDDPVTRTANAFRPGDLTQPH